MPIRASRALPDLHPFSQLEAAVRHESERYLPDPRTYDAAMHLGHMASYREALRYSYGRRVLDLGCGAGYGAFFLAGYGASRVTAVDISGVALAYARRAYRHPSLGYVHTDAEHLPFAERAFDFVFSSQVIEHVRDVEKFMQAVKRLLAPGGFCLFTTPNQRLFSPQGLSSNPHHLNEMSWETYRRQAQRVFASTWFRGIPQRCLRVSDAAAEPHVKPNLEIRLQDYRVQDDHLEECENMLCFGHREEGGRFAPTLPSELQQVADELAPLFWDATLSQWTVLGVIPGNETSPATALAAGHRLIQRFRSPYPGLYRLEFELAEAPSQPLRVMLEQETPGHSNALIFDGMLTPTHQVVEIIFDPRTDSRHRDFTLTVTPAMTWPRWFQRKHAWLVMSRAQAWQQNAQLDDTLLDVQLTLRTFHGYLPAPCV